MNGDDEKVYITNPRLITLKKYTNKLHNKQKFKEMANIHNLPYFMWIEFKQSQFEKDMERVYMDDYRTLLHTYNITPVVVLLVIMSKGANPLDAPITAFILDMVDAISPTADGELDEALIMLWLFFKTKTCKYQYLQPMLSKLPMRELEAVIEMVDCAQDRAAIMRMLFTGFYIDEIEREMQRQNITQCELEKKYPLVHRVVEMYERRAEGNKVATRKAIRDHSRGATKLSFLFNQHLNHIKIFREFNEDMLSDWHGTAFLYDPSRQEVINKPTVRLFKDSDCKPAKPNAVTQAYANDLILRFEEHNRRATIFHPPKMEKLDMKNPNRLGNIPKCYDKDFVSNAQKRQVMAISMLIATLKGLSLNYTFSCNFSHQQRYPEKVPNLRDNHRAQKREWFYGFHSSVFR